jgi:Zn-dependent protease with chaperone function
MPRRPHRALLAVAAATAFGLCQPNAFAATAASPAATPSRQERVERLGRLVAPPGCSSRKLTFRISRRGGLGAWAWQSGRIEITPDLVDALDDDELAAALAHEAAHLKTEDVGMKQPAALAEPESETIERAADRSGCSLLADAGVPPEAMVRMLGKVAMGLRKPAMLDGRIAEASLVCRASNVATVPR